MAEKPEDQVTMDEKIAKGKELFGRGARNYYVKCYVDAADDLSEACKLYGEVYGVDGDELGEVYLLYAKALTALGQDENKLIDVPEEDEEEDEPAEEDDGDTEMAEKEESQAEEKTNGHNDEQKENEPEAGPSSGVKSANENESSNDADEGGDEDNENENENEDEGGNLEVAWEVLQNAALIFQRQEDQGLKNLLEVYNEMAGISMENGNFALALDDFARALNTFDCLDDAERNERIAAEIHYKIGLCQSMEKAYDESVKAFQKAHDCIASVIEKEKSKAEQSEDVLANIKDMEETQQEIMNKITEIGEVKADEIETVKRELTKMYGINGSDPGAGSSSSSSSTAPATAAASASNNSMKSPDAEKPKPTDISHLIKRKKPDSDAVESSPAKKKVVETSPGEKPIAVATDEPEKNEKSEKVAEETASVQVAVDN